MKKFGAKNIAALTMALAIVTVGAVYAQWQYSTSGDYGTDTKGLNFGVTDANQDGDYGSYSASVNPASSYIYIVDQYSVAKTSASYAQVKTGDPSGYGTTPDNHAASLCVETGSNIVITFTASSAANSAVYENGVSTTVTATLTSTGYYGEDSGTWYYSTTSGGYGQVLSYCTNAMFSIATVSITISPYGTGGADYVWEPSGNDDGIFTCTLDEEDLINFINIAYMEVPTYTTYYDSTYESDCFSAGVTATSVNLSVAANT